jgi:hypothetical protein
MRGMRRLAYLRASARLKIFLAMNGGFLNTGPKNVTFTNQPGE